MKIALQVNGQEMTFSEQELIAILENHFANGATKVVSTEKVVQVPTEDEPFEVDPQAIDQELFQKKWEELSEAEKGSLQGNTCQLILEALVELKNNPEKYGRKFKTVMPKKEWDYKTVAELQEWACELGDHNAEWVEQALEWAQRICNGESWKAICNDPDTANWYRLVVGKDGYARLVGGSHNVDNTASASDVSDFYCRPDRRLNHTVPLVVLYEE